MVVKLRVFLKLLALEILEVGKFGKHNFLYIVVRSRYYTTLFIKWTSFPHQYRIMWVSVWFCVEFHDDNIRDQSSSHRTRQTTSSTQPLPLHRIFHKGASLTQHPGWLASLLASYQSPCYMVHMWHIAQDHHQHRIFHGKISFNFVMYHSLPGRGYRSAWWAITGGWEAIPNLELRDKHLQAPMFV